MEENQNSNSDEFTFSEDGKKKKGMGPLKGLLIALVMVFLIIVIGLLIRMVVAGDGDYFKPFKDMFGKMKKVFQINFLDQINLYQVLDIYYYLMRQKMKMLNIIE